MILYKKHPTGKIGTWEISITEEGEDTLLKIETAKVLGGKRVSNFSPVTGKNIGRVNETTPAQQAKLELESRVRKQLDRGYVKTLEQCQSESQATNTLGLTKPMLLQTYKPELVEDWDNAVVQVKLDGHRALYDGLLYSRGGKKINVPHIEEALQGCKLHLDGELYIHDQTVDLDDIGSLVKNEKADKSKLNYYVYDVVMDAPYSERYKALENFTKTLPADSPVILVGNHKVKNHIEAENLRKLFVSSYYEGAVVRHGNSGYMSDKRSSSTLKLKEYLDAEFKIVEVIKGKPKRSNGEVYQVAIYVCETEEGERFKVTAPGTMLEKHEAYINGDTALGKFLTVKYFCFSKKRKVPKQPIALRIRADI